MRGNLLLPPPWAGSHPRVSPGYVEPYLHVRGIQPDLVDIGPLAWEEMKGMSGRIPSEQEVNEKRRWLRDSLVWPDAACFIPIHPDSVEETVLVASYLVNLVDRVIPVVDDLSTLTILEPEELERLHVFEALLVSDEYIPLKNRAPIPIAQGPSTASCQREAILHTGGAEKGWEGIEQLLSQWSSCGCSWSVEAPCGAPPSEHSFQRLAEAGCEELRLRVRSFSPKVRAQLRERLSVEEISAALRAAHRHGMKTAISLEVGSPGESHDVFLNSLRVLHSLSHLIDSVFDLKTYWSPACGESPHHWHDGCANNLSWRQKKCRELAAFLLGEGIPCPWFYLPQSKAGSGSADVIHRRLLGSL